MQISLPKSFVQILTVLGAAVILLFSIIFGINSGKAKAQSYVLTANSKQVLMGLHYFFSDQERFPSAVEFSDENNNKFMLNYFSAFPPVNLPSGSCQQSYQYLRPSIASFKLNVCLPSAIENFNKGWNQLDQDTNFQ